MKKEHRCKCKYCGAKHRQSFMIQLDNKHETSMSRFWPQFVCNDCACEYRKIFFNYQNRESRKRKNWNPLFNAFEAAWLEEERREGLEHREIPQFMKNDYDRLWEIEKIKWETGTFDEESKQRARDMAVNFKRKLEDQNGIS